MLRSLALCLALTGCATFRVYHTPLTAAEGALAVPALVSTAESMGLRAWAQGSQAQVNLQDGTRLYWVPSGEVFVLHLTLPASVPEAELDVRLREAKVQADQIWELAMQARQQSSVGAAVLINPAASPAGTRAERRGAATSGPTAGVGCRSSLDCGTGQFCKTHGSARVCMGNGGDGAPCSSGIDCGSGLFCRSGACAR